MYENVKRIYFLKKLFLHSAKILMDNIFKNCVGYVCHFPFDHFTDDSLNIIHDPQCAYFHSLCCELSNAVYLNNEIYYIISPIHSEDVIVGMYIYDKNIYFINSFIDCKAKEHYTYPNLGKLDKYIALADNFYLKSEKIQQEL